MAGNQSSGKEVTVTEEYESQKWYHSVFGKLIAISISATGLFLVVEYAANRDTQEKEQTKRTAIQAEVQRLKTVEEMTRQYGSELSPEELTDLLRENNFLDRLYHQP